MYRLDKIENGIRSFYREFTDFESAHLAQEREYHLFDELILYKAA